MFMNQYPKYNIRPSTSLRDIRQNLWSHRYWPLAPPPLDLKADAAGLTEIKPLVKYQVATISRAQESTDDKNINHVKSANFWSQKAVKYRSRSWLLYILAFLIEIHPHMKYQLVTINRSWDSTLDKNLNLVYGQTYVHKSTEVRTSTDGCTDYEQPECSMPPAGRGHGDIKMSQRMIKPIKWPVRTAKSQISLGLEILPWTNILTTSVQRMDGRR